MAQGLVPGSRDLYFLLHDILCFDYKLIPTLYPNNQNEENKHYHNVLFNLSSVYLDEAERNCINISKSMKIGFEQNKLFKNVNVSDGIFDIIAEYANCKAFEFDTKGLIANYIGRALTFNDKANSVIYDDHLHDFLNVRGSDVLLPFECNGSIRFDAYLFDHSDEIGLGVIDKSIYYPKAYTHQKEKCLYIYDGGWRGRTAICAFKNHRFIELDKEDSFGRFDWISFCIDVSKQTMTFYKNRQEVVVVDQLIDSNHLVFNIILDKKGDGVYVEKVLCAQ